MSRGKKPLAGDVYGRMTVLRVNHKNRRGTAFVECLCSCGKTKTVQFSLLTYGATKSCGCLSRENSVRRRTPFSGAKKATVFRYYKIKARKRNLDFSIPFEEFILLCQKNCRYCGSPPSNRCKSEFESGDFIYNGIDRVDNSIGYVLGNCVPCCKRCNIAKSDMTRQEFMSWISRVFHHNTGR